MTTANIAIENFHNQYSWLLDIASAIIESCENDGLKVSIVYDETKYYAHLNRWWCVFSCDIETVFLVFSLEFTISELKEWHNATNEERTTLLEKYNAAFEVAFEKCEESWLDECH